MKRSTIVLVELGMLAGIVVAALTAPGSTPLTVFLGASAACFLVGNVLLFAKAKNTNVGKKEAATAWPHLFRALAILTICWLIIYLFSRR